MLVLALDTSTPTVTTGVAELRDGRVEVRADRTVTTPRGHAEILTTLILECLIEARVARSDLDAVVVGCGPGPFTGLRVGMATAAAFADALAIPLHGVCSLDAMAEDTFPGTDTSIGDIAEVLVVTDARRREVYWARYRATGRVEGPCVSTPADLLASIDIAAVDVVAGTPELTQISGPTVSSVVAPSSRGLVAARAVALAAGTSPEPVVPLYLRRPDAVELKDRKR